jgi:hypothetical protein
MIEAYFEKQIAKTLTPYRAVWDRWYGFDGKVNQYPVTKIKALMADFYQGYLFDGSVNFEGNSFWTATQIQSDSFHIVRRLTDLNSEL